MNGATSWNRIAVPNKTSKRGKSGKKKEKEPPVVEQPRAAPSLRPAAAPVNESFDSVSLDVPLPRDANTGAPDEDTMLNWLDAQYASHDTALKRLFQELVDETAAAGGGTSADQTAAYLLQQRKTAWDLFGKTKDFHQSKCNPDEFVLYDTSDRRACCSGRCRGPVWFCEYWQYLVYSTFCGPMVRLGLFASIAALAVAFWTSLAMTWFLAYTQQTFKKMRAPVIDQVADVLGYAAKRRCFVTGGDPGKWCTYPQQVPGVAQQTDELRSEKMAGDGSGGEITAAKPSEMTGKKVYM
eukprot:g173.t1